MTDPLTMTKKKGQLLPNAITAFGLMCGLFVIFKMNMVDPGKGNDEVIHQISAILLLAAFADVLDGAVARAMKVETDFGGLFDSLADAISFGVAPAVVVLKTLSIQPGTQLSFLATAGAMVYAVSGVLRLVRFNVSRIESGHDEELQLEHRKYFTGLPIPGAAAALVATDLLLVSKDCPQALQVALSNRTIFLTGVMFFLGYLMISRLKFPSVKALNVRIASYRLLLLTVLFAAVIFYGVISHFSLVFFSLAWSYILSAFSLVIYRFFNPPKHADLEIEN